MSIIAFECARSWAETPVTVFARNLDQAGQLYAQWVAAHHPGKPSYPAMMYPYGGNLLADLPKLAAAAKLGKVGIGYWDTASSQWEIVSPDHQPVGELVPPEPAVSYFRVEADEGDHAMVFALSLESAVGIYSSWHMDRWGELPVWLTIRRMPRWQLVGPHATLREGMAAGLTGIARWCMDESWHVFPPDYESSGMEG